MCNDVENMDAFDEDLSFVENTKIINKIVDLNTIVQVQQNLDFLNSSWANMVEQEDDKELVMAAMFRVLGWLTLKDFKRLDPNQ